MPSFNRVILVGNLTREVEIRCTASQLAVTDIGLAVNDRVKRNGEWTEETTFVDVTLWGRTAEVANDYARKGDPVLIEGRLKLDEWEKDGQKRTKLKVVGERLVLLGGNRQGGKHEASRTTATASATAASRGIQAAVSGPETTSAAIGEDIPF